MDLTYSLVVSLWCARSGLTIPLVQPFGCRPA